ILNAAIGRDSLAQNDLLSTIVHLRTKDKTGTHAGAIDGPTREGPCHFRYVLLRVTSIDTQGVEFHQLAGIVLINARLSLGIARSRPISQESPDRRRWRGGEMVIQVEQHGRTLSRSEEKVFELSHRTWPDNIHFEVCREKAVLALVPVDIEM